MYLNKKVAQSIDKFDGRFVVTVDFQCENRVSNLIDVNIALAFGMPMITLKLNVLYIPSVRIVCNRQRCSVSVKNVFNFTEYIHRHQNCGNFE